MADEGKGARQQFLVVFDGLEVKPEVAARIDQAIQKAVLQQIAEFDTLGDFNVRLRLPEEFGGRTQGIWVDFPPVQFGG